jgi:hypothetical protein
MEAVELAIQLENVFGYPLQDKEEILDQLAEYLDLNSDQEPEEVVTEFLIDNAHCSAEYQEGECQVDDEQPPEVLARHLTGLFAFNTGYFFGNTGKNAEMVSWLADLNPRDDNLICPVYYKSATQMPRWAVFESPKRLTACQELFYAVQNAYEENPRKHKQLAAELLTTYPQVCQLFAEWFGKFGVTGPRPGQSFPDAGAQRLFDSYDAFLPIAKVMVERVQGNEQAKLGAADLKRIADIGAEHLNYPPHLLLKLLGPALAGDMKEASSVAETIIRQNLGVALTQRWAKRVISHEPPF